MPYQLPSPNTLLLLLVCLALLAHADVREAQHGRRRGCCRLPPFQICGGLVLSLNGFVHFFRGLRDGDVGEELEYGVRFVYDGVGHSPACEVGEAFDYLRDALAKPPR